MKNLLLLSLCVFGLSTRAQVPSYVPTSNLLGWWPLDNNLAQDLSGNGNNGTPTLSPSSITGHLNTANSALRFNGTNYVLVPNAPNLSGFNDMSISLWIQTGATNNVASLVTKWYQSSGCVGDADTYGIWLLPSSDVNYTNNNDVWTGFLTRPTLSVQQLNKWTHVVVTSNAQTGQKMYFNSVLVGTNSSLTGSICNTTGPLTFAAESQIHNPPMHRFFMGDLDDIGIWSRVLTQCEIDNLYLSTLTNCGSVGIETMQGQSNDIAIYPNPSSGKITFRGHNTNAVVHCKILDVSGKLVLEKEFLPAGAEEILNTNLQKGIYMLEIRTDNAPVTHKKLIIEQNASICWSEKQEQGR